MPRDHTPHYHPPAMDQIAEDDVEDLAPAEVVIEHPAVILDTSSSLRRVKKVSKLGVTPEDLSSAARTTSASSRLVVGLNQLTNRVNKEDVQEHAFEVCGVLVPTPTLHTTNTETDQTEEDAREVKDELFYDLIFVAAVIKLSDFAKADVSWVRVLETFELFLLLWTTWLHVTFLFSRFTLPSPWKVLEVLLLLGTLGLALHMVEFSSSEYHVPGYLIASNNALSLDDGRHGTNVDVVHTEGTFRTGLSISVILTRVSILGVYALTAKFAPAAEVLSKTYMIGFGLSLILWIVAAVISAQVSEDTSAVPTLWAVAMVAELLIYPVAALWPINRVSLNIWHIIERQMLWVIVILGESLISIVLPELPCECDVEVYVVIGFSLLLVYNIFQSYINVQPDQETGDLHALQGSLLTGWLWCVWLGMATFAAFLLGVGTKLVVIHANDGQYIEAYAWLLCGSFFMIKLFLSLARLSHSWSPLEIWGITWGRSVLLLLPPAIASLSLFMPRFVDGRKLPKLKGQDLLDALQSVIDDFDGEPSKATLLNVNAAVVNAALGKLDVEDDGLSPLAIVAVLVAMSYIIRWAEMYILWQELKTEMAQSGEGDERPLHDVFRTKTMRRQMHNSMALSAGYSYDQPPGESPFVNHPILEDHGGRHLRRRNQSFAHRFGAFAGTDSGAFSTHTPLGRAATRVARKQTRLLRNLTQHGAGALVEQNQLLPILRTHAMFQHLNEAEQRALVRQFRERHVRAGDVITQAGQPSDAVYIVGSGVFEMKGTLDDKTFTMGELTRESVFGQLSLAANSPCTTTVVAASEHGLLWELHRQKIEASRDVISGQRLLPRASSHSRLEGAQTSNGVEKQQFEENEEGERTMIQTRRHSAHNMTFHEPVSHSSFAGTHHASLGSMGPAEGGNLEAHRELSASQQSGGLQLNLSLDRALTDLSLGHTGYEIRSPVTRTPSPGRNTFPITVEQPSMELTHSPEPEHALASEAAMPSILVESAEREEASNTADAISQGRAIRVLDLGLDTSRSNVSVL
eukprot:m.187288 g.187288  ORF g.187288 m.187288 type:complete len:1030 (+) comp16926_c0_seq1:205-3294(+)